MASRHGTKYRPSLSCSVCRRRKVRCGKEKPSCGNCVRMNEVCEYDRAPGAPSSDRSSGAGLDANFDMPVPKDVVDESSTCSPWNSATFSQKRTRSPSEQLHSTEIRDSGQAVTKPFPRISDTSGLFMYQDKIRPRFVDSTFWGYVPGQESTCDELLNQEHRIPNANFPLLDMTGLLYSTESIPTKSISEALFSSFMIGVRPLHCLIHESSLRAAFDAIFTMADNHLPVAILMTNPTWVCLVYSMLYCGALVAQPSAWASPPLKELHRETVIEHLSLLLFKSLEHAQYTKVPTLNTISALLLARSCAKKPTEAPLEDVFFVNMVVRMAQTMGLHREDAISKMDPVSQELSRRIWWHIRWLDVQVSVVGGTESNCGCTEQGHDTKPIEINRTMTTGLEVGNTAEKSRWVEGAISKIFSAGRFEAARFQWAILKVARDLDGMESNRIVYLTDALNKFHIKLDTLIGQMPAVGVPERGMVPSRIANASPSSHANLYLDSESEPTVFSSWARIVLSIIKSECALMLYKLLLGREDYSEEEATWEILAEYCLSDLRNFLQLVQTPAFAPYLWFSITRCAPLLATNLSIMYLKRAPEPEKRQQVRYFVDEVIDFYAPGVAKPNDGSFRATDKTPAAWRMLRTLRDKLDQQSISRQSLDDLATEALASKSNSSTIQDTPMSQETDDSANHHDDMIATSDKMVFVAEAPEQQIAENMTEVCVPEDDHTSCSEGFRKISQQFFENISELQEPRMSLN